MGSILLVETDPGRSVELKVGHAVLISSMRDAPTLLRDGGFDLVVIDCHDNCVGVVELARNIETLPDAPPIVLVSSSPHAPEISVRIGAQAFVPKPCEPSELAHVVDRLLGTLRPVVFEDEPTGRTHI